MTSEQSEQFYITEISDDIFLRMKGKSYKDDCTLPVSELRYLHILHNDFHGNTVSGELVCNRLISEDVLDIFRKLFEAGYQINSVRLVDDFDADDEKSMAANNSSSFNFRFISFTDIISRHGLGMAVDINPLFNPYIKTVSGRLNIEPANASEYADRSKNFEHKIDENDLAYRLFTEHGFFWGGHFKDSRDYHHFEIPAGV